jgi:hypothetical protein
VKPALQRPHTDAQILGDLPMLSSTSGHQDGLATVPQPAVWSAPNALFELTTFVFGLSSLTAVWEDDKINRTKLLAPCIGLNFLEPKNQL